MTYWGDKVPVYYFVWLIYVFMYYMIRDTKTISLSIKNCRLPLYRFNRRSKVDDESFTFSEAILRKHKHCWQVTRLNFDHWLIVYGNTQYKVQINQQNRWPDTVTVGESTCSITFPRSVHHFIVWVLSYWQPNPILLSQTGVESGTLNWSLSWAP